MTGGLGFGTPPVIKIRGNYLNDVCEIITPFSYLRSEN